MFVVFWLENKGGTKTPRFEEFAINDMTGALRLTERLRSEQRKDGSVSHVALSSENPQSVGRPGVAEPAPDYNWKKRRA